MNEKIRNWRIGLAIIGVLFLSGFMLYGCATGPATKLQITPGFVPKKVYNIGYEQMWDKVLPVLRKEKIILASINKENGIIQTDYIPGWTVMARTTYRYKYQIAFEKINPLQTRVEITCKLEAKIENPLVLEQIRPYDDVTYKEEKSVIILELWLYEQIEGSLY